ncbi:HD domain-containing protein [Dehalococcoidia bacterium]|nr:HD domain-containing protein [Dehalococcoidia bacterium]
MCGTEISGDNEKIIDRTVRHIVDEYQKGKRPLFVVGSGISMDLQTEQGQGTMSIPTMDKTIEKLHSLYKGSDKTAMSKADKEYLSSRFDICSQHLAQDSRRLDRPIVAGILGHFQENEHLKKVWVDFNEWLLNRCVDENRGIGIIKAHPSTAHERIAELYEKVDAFCLTINFDGLFYKALKSKYGQKQVFSYYIREDAERFFKAENIREKYYAEIEVRGDIFFVQCDPEWCEIYPICDIRSTTATRIWESKEPLKCEKGKQRKPYVSFPGAYEKDQEVRQILGVLWQYLTHQVSCVITIGIGGWWDPILIAFLSDLLRERGISLIDVNPCAQRSCIKEIATDESSLLPIKANDFMEKLTQSIDTHLGSIRRRPQRQITYSSRDTEGEDWFWAQGLGRETSEFERALMAHPLLRVTNKFAQLGLESRWWGIPNRDRLDHNRLNHSKGVMKIATFLYENACKNSERSPREEEKQFLRIAALLHDIGHLPFCHSIEKVFQELNWKPAGYIESFTHDHYTEEKVKEIFEDPDFPHLETQLCKIGYTEDDLIKLIRGEFGIGFLDAIINGPIDADKIDYVFRDSESINFTQQINREQLLHDMGKDISISPMGLLVLKGSSARAAFRILELRERLYKEFYLSAHFGLLEAALRLIVITYFVHKYNTVDLFTDEKQRLSSDGTRFSDLGAIKIAKAAQELENLARKFEARDDIEIAIVEHMKEFLDTLNIDKRVKAAIDVCFDLIMQVTIKQEDKQADNKKAHRTWCIDEESKRRQKLAVSEFPRERMKKIRQDAKTVTLRFPGAILIEVVPPFEFFKIGEARKRKARSDGTNVSSECMLSGDLDRLVERHKSGREHEQGQVRVYKVGEESEVKAALALFEHLLREEERLVGEE